MSAVILFRDQAKEGDDYSRLVSQDHSYVASVPAIGHQMTLTAADVDRVLAMHESAHPFDALILTSKNAVAALSQAVCAWHSQGDLQSRRAQWQEFMRRPVFVVGRATAAACRQALGGSAELDIRGEDSGKATVLLPEILAYCSQFENRRCRLLFFCGDLRRDTLPDRLRSSGLADLEEVVAYTTVGLSAGDIQYDLAERIGSAVQACAGQQQQHSQAGSSVTLWLVFFSPSGVRAVWPVLQNLPEMLCHSLHDSQREPRPAKTPLLRQSVSYRMAAIGDTTLAALISHGANRCEVTVALTPTAEGVRKALCEGTH
ncbi:tetrapyrrole biosynthesis, uroporphyrinogen III synthase [Linderina pennispora]|uniref:Tetrapyrrole biosynthesis, uroporphyrinogen III synthase n=1 Tax=Linderina pennispora TaxID=61395 RepID=A0A1Y1WAB3_9FUNG|nr:tetrapyrrole biosynthesis, uroporphyrinogen III synthase [Linderina pennispora]ORX70315.1 tetrapyrrole biosynthesis, uroporphyrinogen III synthase [Linderina pennispora]